MCEKDTAGAQEVFEDILRYQDALGQHSGAAGSGGLWFKSELGLLSVPIVPCSAWVSSRLLSSQKHVSGWNGYKCVHDALRWTDVPSRVYSCLTLNVPATGSGSTVILTRIKRLLATGSLLPSFAAC